MNIAEVRTQLEELAVEVNSRSPIYPIRFNQQDVIKAHMSFTGGIGRLCITPMSLGYDISLSGIEIESYMYPFMRSLCGRECDGYKQLNSNVGRKSEPYWRVADFNIVKKAVYFYANAQSSSFDEYLMSIGKSAKTAKNYNGAILGPISKWAVENGFITNSIAEIDDLTNYEVLAHKIRGLDIYKERNSVGKGMYNAALNSYADYISDTKGELVERDINEILLNHDIDETQKAALVNTRIGQGTFRNNLIRYWSGCAITRYRNSNLLVASHIKPWRVSENHERLDVYNGLLLLPNLDKAFDKGFITFESDGGICISRELEEPRVLGVTEEMRINLSSQHEHYMRYHREEVYRD